MTTFTVRTANGAKILERARSRGVPLYRIRLSENRLTFCTKQAFVSTMIAILENMCYHKRDGARSSLGKNDFCVENVRNAKTLFARAALGVFALAFLAACFFVNGRVLEIEVISDNPPLVQSLLDEAGIKRGGKVQDIKELEHFLNRKLDARYVFVRKQGVKLTVEVWAREGQPLEIAQDHLYAPCDGVVQSVVLLSGTAKIKAGDSVKAGDLLIEGKIVSENGGEIFCRAVGQVFLACEEVREYEVETVRRSPFRTGRKRTYTQIVFPFGAYGKAAEPFGESETVATDRLIGGMFPLTVRTVEIYEIGYLEERIDFEKIRDLLIAEKIGEAVRDCEHEVLSSRAEVTEGEASKKITVTLTTLVSCGGAIGNTDL